jgi:hypothetical protein
MKKKYNVNIHKSGENNSAILEMIANVNGGVARLSLLDIVGYVNSQKCRWPLTKEKFDFLWDTRNPAGTTLHISEDGCETFTMSITQVELHELTNVVTVSEEILIK